MFYWKLLLVQFCVCCLICIICLQLSKFFFMMWWKVVLWVIFLLNMLLLVLVWVLMCIRLIGLCLCVMVCRIGKVMVWLLFSVSGMIGCVINFLYVFLMMWIDLSRLQVLMVMLLMLVIDRELKGVVLVVMLQGWIIIDFVWIWCGLKWVFVCREVLILSGMLMKVVFRFLVLFIVGRCIMVEWLVKCGMLLLFWGWWKILDIVYYFCFGSNIRL